MQVEEQNSHLDVNINESKIDKDSNIYLCGCKSDNEVVRKVKY